MRLTERQRGFTFVELLVAGVIIIGLMLLMLFLITPKNRTADMHDAQRRTHIARIMQAIVAYYHREGMLPPTITTKDKLIGAVEDQGTNLCKDLVPAYLHDMLFDPTGGVKDNDVRCDDKDLVYTTGYLIKKSKDNKSVTISAPLAEHDKDIHLTRTFAR